MQNDMHADRYTEMKTGRQINRQPIETTDGRRHTDKQKDRLLNELIDKPNCNQWTGCWMYRNANRKTTIYRQRDKNADRQSGKQPCTDRQTDKRTDKHIERDLETDRPILIYT